MAGHADTPFVENLVELVDRGGTAAIARLGFCVMLRAMSPSLATGLRPKRRATPVAAMNWKTAAQTCTALASDARLAASEIEVIFSRILDAGVLFEINRYAALHNKATLPDLTEAARALRSYSGCLCLMANDLARRASPEEETR